MTQVVINRCYGGFGLSYAGVIRYAQLKGIVLTWQPEHFSYYDIPRDDTALVQTVQELGKGANGWAADLAVVEVPDEVEWEIGEYDGLERVEEKHRTWS